MPSLIMSRIASSSFRHEHTKLVGRSPFTGKVTESDQLDWCWRGKFTYVPMRRAQAAPLLAAIKAATMAAPLRVYDPDFHSALTGFTGAANIDGAGQTGTAINIQTSPPVISTLIAKAGDKIYIRDLAGTNFQMFELLADLTTNASGKATMQLDCAWRGTLYNALPVAFSIDNTFMTPSIAVRVIEWSETPVDKAGWSVITLAFEEIV